MAKVYKEYGSKGGGKQEQASIEGSQMVGVC
jgi:hypothetical protein